MRRNGDRRDETRRGDEEIGDRSNLTDRVRLYFLEERRVIVHRPLVACYFGLPRKKQIIR